MVRIGKYYLARCGKVFLVLLGSFPDFVSRLFVFPVTRNDYDLFSQVSVPVTRLVALKYGRKWV